MTELLYAIIIGLAIGIIIVYGMMRMRFSTLLVTRMEEYRTKYSEKAKLDARAEYRLKHDDEIKVEREAACQAAVESYKREHAESWRLEKEQACKAAVAQSRSTLKGKIGEQMAPMFREFQAKYEPSDARFLGAPIDYVIFRNYSKSRGKKMDDNADPIEVVFVDVKAGKSQLSSDQKRIKDAVEAKRVSFDTLRISDQIDSSVTRDSKSPI